jgi:hypothetical protein
METKIVTIKLPICIICKALPPRVEWADFEGNFEILPTQWTIILNKAICHDCMDRLRSIFMEEQNLKETRPLAGVGASIRDMNDIEKEEHWLTRNGTRVVVNMPLPAVGYLFLDKQKILRWGQDYNCQEVSWYQAVGHDELADFDLAERLEDSVKKEQGSNVS